MKQATVYSGTTDSQLPSTVIAPHGASAGTSFSAQIRAIRVGTAVWLRKIQSLYERWHHAWQPVLPPRKQTVRRCVRNHSDRSPALVCGAGLPRVWQGVKNYSQPVWIPLDVCRAGTPPLQIALIPSSELV